MTLHEHITQRGLVYCELAARCVEAPVTEPFGSFTRSFVLGTARGAEAWGRQKVRTEALEKNC